MFLRLPMFYLLPLWWWRCFLFDLRFFTLAILSVIVCRPEYGRALLRKRKRFVWVCSWSGDWRVAWRHCHGWMWQHLAVLLKLRSLSLSLSFPFAFAFSTPHQHQRATGSLPNYCVSTRGGIKLNAPSASFLSAAICRNLLMAAAWGSQLASV